MRTINKITDAFALNKRMYSLAIAYVASALILRYPKIAAWLPGSQRTMVFEFCDWVTTFATGLALWWAKDKLMSGNGSAENPYERRKPQPGSKMKLPVIIVISAIALALSGCAGVSATVRKTTPYGDITVRSSSGGKTDVEWSW